jgi:hypothetical protein
VSSLRELNSFASSHPTFQRLNPAVGPGPHFWEFLRAGCNMESVSDQRAAEQGSIPAEQRRETLTGKQKQQSNRRAHENAEKKKQMKTMVKEKQKMRTQE